jgi:hypothetical protein
VIVLLQKYSKLLSGTKSTMMERDYIKEMGGWVITNFCPALLT